MAYFLTPSSHYLSQRCFLILERFWHSPESNFRVSAQASNLYKKFERYALIHISQGIKILCRPNVVTVRSGQLTGRRVRFLPPYIINHAIASDLRRYIYTFSVFSIRLSLSGTCTWKHICRTWCNVWNSAKHSPTMLMCWNSAQGIKKTHTKLTPVYIYNVYWSEGDITRL